MTKRGGDRSRDLYITCQQGAPLVMWELLPSDHVGLLSAKVIMLHDSFPSALLVSGSVAYVGECAVITCYVPIITFVDRSIWESFLLWTLMTAEALNRRGREPPKANNKHIVIFICLRRLGQLPVFKRFDLADIKMASQMAAVHCGHCLISARSCWNETAAVGAEIPL